VKPPIVVDIDLSDPRQQLTSSDRPLHALLWWGHRVVGEQRLESAEAAWPELREHLLTPVRATVRAIESVTAEPTEPRFDARDVTVVVCTRDRPRLLAGCLAALGQLNPAPAEIVVVDNVPTSDQAGRLARDWGVRHSVEDRPGLSHARNTGWRSAGTSVVAFTDDDARPHARWVAGLCRGFSAPEIACVTGPVVPAELMTPAQRVFEANGGMSKGFSPQLFSAGSVGLQGFRLGAGANMAFTRDVLEAIGGFDTRLGAGRRTRGSDDLDAFVQVLRSGTMAAYQPDAVVRHVHRRDVPGLLRQYRDNGTGYAALLRKYEVSGGEVRAAAIRERARWRRQRHVRSLLGAVRRREAGRFVEIAAEAVGSLRGPAAFDAEAAFVAGGGRK